MTDMYYVDRNGYYRCKCCKELVHRFAMEEFLGRKLKKGEIVHHINNDKLDNRIENLQVMNKKAHEKLHWHKVLSNGQRCVDCGVLMKNDKSKPRCYACWAKKQFGGS